MGYPIGRVDLDVEKAVHFVRLGFQKHDSFVRFDLDIQLIPSTGNDRGDDGGGAADAGRAGAGEEEVRPEGRQGQVHLEEAMTDLQ